MIYFITLSLIFFGVFQFDIRQKNRAYLGLYIMLFFLLTFVTGFRFRVGGDSLMYEDAYFPVIPHVQEIGDFMKYHNYYNLQYLYVYFVSFCKSLNNDYYFYQFIHSLIVNTVIFWFIWRNTKYKFIVILLLYVSLIYFYFTYEIQREILAICCFLLSYNSFVKNRWFKYFLFSLIAFSFHVSAFILFVLPFFKFIRLTNKFLIISILLSLPFILFKSSFASLIQSLSFNEIIAKKAAVYSKIEFSMFGVISFYFVRVILLLPLMKFYIKNKDNLLYNYDWLFSAFFIFSIFSQVFVGSERFLNYLFIPFIIALVNLLTSKTFHFKRYKRSAIYLSLCVNLFFVINYKILLDYRYHYVYFPYTSIFKHETNPERENYIKYILH